MGLGHRRVILTLDTERLRTLADVRGLLDGSSSGPPGGCLRIRAADGGAVPLRNTPQAAQGVDQMVYEQGDGPVPGTVNTAERLVPGDGANRKPPLRPGAACRATLHSGGHPPHRASTIL